MLPRTTCAHPLNAAGRDDRATAEAVLMPQ